MMVPSVSVTRKVVVDDTRLVEEVSPTRMSILLKITICTHTIEIWWATRLVETVWTPFSDTLPARVSFLDYLL
jgi:hypothetical protein